MTLRLTFGIDPGVSGAIAMLLDGEPGPILDMPARMVGDWSEVDAEKLAAWIRSIGAQHPGAYVSACTEKVGARPTDGSTSAFRFGESSGRVKGVLEALAIPYTRAIPAVWKRHFDLLKKEKDDARLLAIKLFPRAAMDLTRKNHNGRADALLIARWHESTQAMGMRAA